MMSLFSRLWLTSYPTDSLPVTILQESVKLTVELAAGLKNNLVQSYSDEFISEPTFFDIDCDDKQTLQPVRKSIIFFYHVSWLFQSRILLPLVDHCYANWFQICYHSLRCEEICFFRAVGTFKWKVDRLARCPSCGIKKMKRLFVDKKLKNLISHLFLALGKAVDKFVLLPCCCLGTESVWRYWLERTL